jgi:hypothetical protein
MASVLLLFTTCVKTHRMSFSPYINFFQGFAEYCTEEWRRTFSEAMIDFNLYVYVFF